MPQEKATELYAGVDIGGTKLHAVVANARGKIVGRARRKLKGERRFGRVLDQVRTVVDGACQQAGVERHALRAVGVGAPSQVLPDGTAVHAPNLGWKNVPLVEALTERLDRPVFGNNDCNVGTIGEYAFGAGRSAKTLVGLFMGTGLGGGILVRGKLISGENHQAAEVGHMVIVPGGRRCGCGGHGCLEAYASKTGIGRRITCEVHCEQRRTLLTAWCEGDYHNIRSSLLARAYAKKDAVAVDALHEAADYLGYGIGNLITLLGPDVVVLGGGVIEALGKALLPRIARATRQVTFPPSSFGDTRIRLAKLGDDAVALGAVAWAASHTP